MHTYFGSGICLAAILVLQLIPLPRQQIAMLDIGQGDSVLFQDGTMQVLVDGGPGAAVLEQLTEAMSWFDRTIEVIVATHYDKDHIEGITHILDRYDVGMIILPHYYSTTNLSKSFIEKIIEKKIPYRFGWYGQSLAVGDMYFRVMSPIPGQEWERLSKNKSNNASVVMRADILPLGVRPLSVILTGDAEEGIERQLLERIPSEAFTSDILKVGHHGSKYSTTVQFVDAISPAISLISVGAHNTYGHPTQETLGRLLGTSIFRTDHDGTISFTLTSSGWRISCGNKTDLPFTQHLCINR